MTPPKLYKVDEAAKLLSIGKRKLWQLISAGKIRVVKLPPRSTRIRADDLAKFIEKQTTRA